jgi:hypothetical protein
MKNYERRSLLPNKVFGTTFVPKIKEVLWSWNELSIYNVLIEYILHYCKLVVKFDPQMHKNMPLAVMLFIYRFVNDLVYDEIIW